MTLFSWRRIFLVSTTLVVNHYIQCGQAFVVLSTPPTATLQSSKVHDQQPSSPLVVGRSSRHKLKNPAFLVGVSSKRRKATDFVVLLQSSSSSPVSDDELANVAEDILLPPRPSQELSPTSKQRDGESSIAIPDIDMAYAGAAEDENDLIKLPRHSHEGVNTILIKTERVLKALHKHWKRIESSTKYYDQYQYQYQQHTNNKMTEGKRKIQQAKEAGRDHEAIYANSYVDLGKINIVGFDFDYTLVTYTEDLLELIYGMALKRLVSDRQYPMEMTQIGLQYDPFFSIRGLAVDRETGWITHLSYTHKVAVAWEGREKLPTSKIFEEYRGKRALNPKERRNRLKPLNDLFSMAECCLIADTIQFFKDRNIPYCAQSVVSDVLNSVTATHLSGDFHRIVAQDPQKYFDPTPHLPQVLTQLKASGKRLIFVSNSPFWYVDAGMRYVFGPNWRTAWDAIITSAGKPNFYTDESRPFREVCQDTRRIMFKRVDRFESGKVYTEGCLKELARLMDWVPKPQSFVNDTTTISAFDSPMSPLTANVLYIGDSLFADLVDAKREFGWTTAAVTPEVGYEKEVQNQAEFARAQRSVEILLNALRLLQMELGASMRTQEDLMVLDALERLVSRWRDRETYLLGSPFGSVFRARYQPSLFAHSLRRYCDLYMTSVSSMRHYSPQHRFYPEQAPSLLAHEIQASDPTCWDLEEVLSTDSEDDDEPQLIGL